MNVTYLCLGGNIGDRETALNQAILIISQEIGNIVSKSGIYETEAWGVENQQAYLNQCIAVTTNLTAEELIHSVLVIEKQLGRERSNSITYEPRIIDIDIIFYNNTIIETPQLTVPHPRLHLRKFVLIPLNEIASNHLHPILNKTIFNLLSDCEDQSEVKEFKQK
ncbi:MAG: 2-amino-4-hydroxy-6-hydroxymethyldihydropteridine diphosphokinase [Bacteroidia bacterium]|nr:2-amino-4-hydroxy-6-hydroxymethyldihydropteridine diphosphokinase [Bacteroidia bacterium]